MKVIGARAGNFLFLFTLRNPGKNYFMLIIPFVLIILFCLAEIFKNARKKLYEDFSSDLSDEEFSLKISKLAKKLATPEPFGKGVEITPAEKAVRRAYRMIKKKVVKGETLYEAEKWLYDNNYVFSGIFDKGVPDFGDLPHSGGVPRVLILMRACVATGAGNVTEGRIIEAVSAMNEVNPLTYREATAVGAALKFALLEKTAACANKCVYIERMRLSAEKSKKLLKKYIKNNVYLYFIGKHNMRLKAKIDGYLDKSARTFDDVEFVFGSLIAETDLLTSSLVGSLINADAFTKKLYEYLPVYKVYSADSVFDASDETTKKLYLEKTAVLSDRVNLREDEYAKRLLSLASDGEHFGNLLFSDGKALNKSVKNNANLISKNRVVNKAALYISGHFLIAAAFASVAGLLAGGFVGGIIAGVVAFAAFLPAAYSVNNYLFSHFIKKRPVMRTGYKEIPDFAKTDVVVPVFAGNADSLKENLARLYETYLANKGKNATFTLLVDFKGSDKVRDDDDDKLYAAIETYGKKGVRVAVRRRSDNGEGGFSGRERKRGAVEDYAKFLYDGNNENFCYLSEKEWGKPEFFIVLDADSVLAPGSVLDAVNALLHPMNEKYDLLAFDGKTDAFSLESLYSRLFYGGDGYEKYPSYSSLFFDVTGRALFTGKGIFRLESYVRKLYGRLPEKRILSHDILEGAVLETGRAGVSVYESVPLSFASDEERRMRWTRGDIQLLPFLNFAKSDDKKDKIPFFYAYIMFFNAISVISAPAYAVLFALAAAFSNVNLAIISAVTFFADFVISAADNFFAAFVNKRMFACIKDAATVFVRRLFALSVLPYAAVSDAVLFSVSCVKTALKKNLLKWKPFYAGKYEKKRAKVKPEIRQYLMGHAVKAYAYFRESRTTLIADNFNELPKNERVNYTSPTNIGFSVIAEISAYFLGIVPKEEAENRVFETVTAALSLEKYRGHLYNWYDVGTGKPLYPEYVSSVDSANFITALITAREIFGGKTGEAVDSYLEEVDFTALFDEKAGLFYIGYDKSRNRFSGHYDNVVSEARLLAYLGVCFGVPVESWCNLAREFTSEGGNTLLSFGGTAFEYLMPDLFLDTPAGGLLKSTSKSAVKIMTRRKCKGLFGISESGYFDLDDNRNFAYKAFGLDNLSLKSDPSKCVISPYSSFLMLDYAEKEVVKNLKKLENRWEMNGRYGLYEALDLSGAPRIVCEYMAHHLGMTLAAIADHLTDGAIRRAFSEAPEVHADRIILSERRNDKKGFRPDKNVFVYDAHEECRISRKVSGMRAEPLMHVLSSSDYVVVADDAGAGYSKKSGIAINRFRNDPNIVCGMFFYVTDEDGKVSSPCAAPVFSDGDYSTVFENGFITYENRAAGLSERIACPCFFEGEVRTLSVKNDCDSDKKYRVTFYFDLALNYTENEIAHPVFSDMFVETEKDGDVFIARRRERDNNKGMFLGVRADGCNAVFSSDGYSFLSRGHTAKNPAGVFGKRKNEEIFGAVLDPACIFSADIDVKAFSTKEIDVYITAGTSREGVLRELAKTRQSSFRALSTKRNAVKNAITDKRFFDISLVMTSKLIYEPFSAEKIIGICRYNRTFMRYSHNFTRKPLLFVYDGNKNALKRALTLSDRWLSAGIAVSLIVSYSDRDGYFAPVRREITEVLDKCVTGRDVFLDEETPVKILEEICFYDFSKICFSEEKTENPSISEVTPAAPPEILFGTGEGGFSRDAYEVVPFYERTLLPYQNVICGTKGGTVVTDGGGGYTYYGNSRESKLTEWRNDYTSDIPSERILLFDGDTSAFDLKAGAHVSHCQGESRFSGSGDGFTSEVSEYMICDGGAKVFEVTVTASGDIARKLFFVPALVLGARKDGDYIFMKTEDGIREAVNVKNGVSSYLKAFSGKYDEKFFPRSRGAEIPSASMNNATFSAYYDVNLKAGESETYRFVFGGDYKSVRNARTDDMACEKRKSTDYFKKLNVFSIETGNRDMDVLFNHCLAYQTVSSRINGKTSLYQAGGATGFRDMAQDLLTFVYIDPARTRKLLLDLASHVYYEGDVMHWWHGERHGVRTRISDDGLFLPYAVTEYVSVTGDDGILRESVPYLLSARLSVNEEDRFEIPDEGKRDSLLAHLERIVNNAYRIGENGLLKIGSGDWNDALNAVGTETAGESVWLTEFYIAVLKRMSTFYEGKEKLFWADRAEKLSSAVLKTFENGRFKRLVTASGEWLGGGKSKAMKIDAISEAWASLAGINDKKKVNDGLTTAKKDLFDRKNGMFLLLAPPFDENGYYGYISLYPEGIRENGGQYTHGAMWFILALINEGRTDEAYEIFNAINPVEKCRDEKTVLKYKGEPYVLAADVYSNSLHEGRAGWTWYTGSASWCYKTVIEGFLGVRIENRSICVNPRPPAGMDEYTVKYDDGKSRYIFRFRRGGEFMLVENGVELKSVSAIPIREGDNRIFDVIYP